MNAVKHAELSVRRLGGDVEDYLSIHDLIDSTKILCADNRHRILHTLWGVHHVIIPIVGHTVTNSRGRRVNVKDLCERDHILPDYRGRFIPTLGDFVAAMKDLDAERWIEPIRHVHERHGTTPAVSRLLLSPLGVTGELKSLVLTHNSWFLRDVLPRVLPGHDVPIEELEISSVDLFAGMRLEPWMDNGMEIPPSAGQVYRGRVG